MIHWIRFLAGRNSLKIRAHTTQVAWVKQDTDSPTRLMLILEFNILWMTFTVWTGVTRPLSNAIIEELSEPPDARIARFVR